MEQEQTIFDVHDVMVTYLSLCLQELAVENEKALPTSTPATGSSQHLGRRLHYIGTSMENKICDSMGGLVPGRDLDECLLQVLESESTSSCQSYLTSLMTS